MKPNKKPTKVYRKKRMTIDYAKAHKLHVAVAHRDMEAIEIICAALRPLTIFQRNKVFRMLEIALEKDPNPKRTATEKK